MSIYCKIGKIWIIGMHKIIINKWLVTLIYNRVNKHNKIFSLDNT